MAAPAAEEPILLDEHRTTAVEAVFRRSAFVFPVLMIALGAAFIGSVLWVDAVDVMLWSGCRASGFGCGVSYFDLDLAMSATVMSAVLGIATLFAWTGYATGRRGRRILAKEMVARSIGVKEWFLQGLVNETEFERLTKLFLAFGKGRFPGVLRRRTGRGLFRAGLILVAGVVPFLTLYIDISDAWRETGPASYALVLGAMASVFLAGVLATVAGVRFRRQGKETMEGRLQDLEALETEVLTGARERRIQPGAPRRPAAPEAGPSFRPWARTVG